MRNAIKRLKETIGKRPSGAYIHADTLLFVATATLLMALPASYEPHHFAKTLLAGSLLQSAAYAVLLAWLSQRLRPLRGVVLALLFVLFAIETYSFACFGSRLNPGVVTLILQTSLKETAEFVRVYVLRLPTLAFVAAGAAAVGAYVWLHRRASSRRWPAPLWLRVGSGLVVAAGLSLFVVPLPFPVGQNTPGELWLSLQFVRAKHGEMATMKAMTDRIAISHTPARSEAPVLVLVIGESFNKHHSSLYGYALPTSPRLAAERDSGRLVVFTQASTPTNGTAYAMRFLFTQQGCEQTGDSTDCVLMPAVFRRAGYRVAYFDNQYTRSSGGALDYSCGYFLNPTAINDRCFDYRNTQTTAFDADFVAQELSHMAHSRRSLNIIHLMGQHFDAALRYPASFRRFTADDIQRPDLSRSERRKVAEYDNATLYNDHTLGRIIDAFRSEEAVVVYLSDHGEQIYDGPGHYFGRSFGSARDPESLRNVFQVPLVVWLSDAYRQRHPDVAGLLRHRAHWPVCTADLPYLLYDLAFIGFNYHQPERSLASPAFRPHATRID